jgi:ABC-type antimicrobial peptide transport system permease subunit
VVLGVALGIAGAFAGSRYVSTLLYGVTASDAATFLPAAFGLASSALIAGYVPARRAARADPLITLRAE